MADPRERLLITGSSGYVARLLQPGLRERYHLRLLDVAEQRCVEDDEILRIDICDTERVVEACRGVSGVVHLAGHPDEADFRSVLMPDNVLGTWSVFEAAVRAAVPRVVFASTVQTMLGEANGTLRPAEPPRPISVYACSKLFGEAVARYHADVHGLQVACLRIGWVVPPDSRLFRVEADLPNLWCAPADLLALILAALQSPVRFATVVVVSPPATGRFDVANPYGWRPNELPAVRRGRWASIRSVRVARRIRRRPGSGP